MGKFFTTTVKCPIDGAAQHAAFTAGDILFDWTSFEIPKGGARLLAVTALIRAKGDAGPTPNIFKFSLIFGKEGTTLGADNAVAFLTGKITTDIFGSMEVDSVDFIGPAAVSTQCLAVATADAHTKGVVFQPDPTSGTNVGYDKFYVAGIANGAFDFRTIMRINDDDIASSSPGTTLVIDGSSILVEEHIIVDDELIAHDEAVIGTVASITNTTTMELDDAIATGVLAADDYVYVKHPITLHFHFEK